MTESEKEDGTIGDGVKSRTEGNEHVDPRGRRSMCQNPGRRVGGVGTVFVRKILF